MSTLKHCAEFNGQFCTCETIIWAAQEDRCDCADKSTWHNKCMYLGDMERCDNPKICDELKNGQKPGRTSDQIDEKA